jgi:hypothetical protein
MTVTIAALGGATHTSQTGSFVMCADTLISYCAAGVPISANQGGTKIYDLPHGFYVAIADDISRSQQVVGHLYLQMKSLDPNDPKLGDLIKLALDRTAEYVRLWMRREVLTDYGVTLDEFLHDGGLVERNEIADEIKHRAISTELVICGFAKGNNPICDNPVLMYTDCGSPPQEQTNPGFFCGGAGKGAALDWLNFRKQNCFMSVQRTFYHVREAKQYSEVSPVVGGLNQTILIRPGRPMVDVSQVPRCLNEWGNAMFPKPTDILERSDEWDKFADAYGIK